MSGPLIFERAVCLTVDHRINETVRVREACQLVGLQIEFFTVGTGELLPLKCYDHIDVELPAGSSGWYMNLPHSYNAFLCFQKIIRAAHDDRIKNLLIIEDDVVFLPNFNDVFERSSDELLKIAPDWDMLYLGASHRKARTLQVAEHLLQINGSLCFHAVAISSRMFSPIISLIPHQPIDKTIADELHRYNKCFACWPNIAWQKKGYSFIGQRYVRNNKNILHTGMVCTSQEELYAY